MKNLSKTKVAIIGLGLIGGSIGLLLKKKVDCHVIGFSLHRRTLKKALKIGAIDKIADSIKEVQDADIVFIATPTSVVSEILKKIAKFLKPGCIVTDVASIKEKILKEAERILPKNVSFIGSHPVAGKEKSGIDAAEVDLLKGCFWVLTPGRNTNPKALEKLKEIIVKLGAKPSVVDPKWHDEAVACVSHLPAVLSSVLCLTVGKEKDWQKIQQLAAEGFRDTSRLAANPPLLHTDFCLGSKRNIRRLIGKTIRQLENFQKMIKENNRSKIFDFFKKAQKKRKEWLVKSRFTPAPESPRF